MEQSEETVSNIRKEISLHDRQSLPTLGCSFLPYAEAREITVEFPPSHWDW